MKRVVVIIFLVAAMYAQQENTTQSQPNQTQKLVPQKTVDPDADLPHTVLVEFGKALNHFGNIVADPKNGTNVGANMVGIFGNIITIAAQAFKRNHQDIEENLDQIEEMFLDLCTDPVFCKQLFTMVEEEATRVKRSIRCDA